MAKDPKKAGAEPQVHPADGEAVGHACPICQTQIVRGEGVLECPSCGLTYHEECWKENSGCGAYGCEAAPETIKAKTEEVPAGGWGGEKRCPACGQKIKGAALVCIHCKAQFWTREPISRELWERREYTGAELDRVRNVMIVVFLASTCGCLFPITGALTAHWIWSGSGIYPYARLPASMQILLKASFGAACAWCVAFVLAMLSNLGHH